MMSLLLPEDPTSEMHLLRQIDIAERLEIALRYITVSGVCLALSLISGYQGILWGVLFYLGTNIAYMTALAVSFEKASLVRFWATAFLGMVSSGSFAAMAVVVTLIDGMTFTLVGLAGIFAMALHSLRRHKRLSILAVWDVLLIVVSVSAVSIGHTLMSDSLTETIILLVTGLATGAYFTYSFVETLRARTELQRRMDMDIEQSRLQAIANLTAGVAHDFNNLLTVIRGNIELGEMLPKKGERAKALAEAREACDRAANLVAQLMAFARKSRISPKPLQLLAFLQKWQQMAQRLLPASLEVELDVDHAAVVFADPTLLETALLNVAINARDALAGKPGHLFISVSSGVFCSDDARCRCTALTLTDSGPGAAPEVLSQMTEPFFTTKPVGQGTGLGLSMIKGFTEQSGGKLKIQNAHRGGLEVTILLPETDPTLSPESPEPLGTSVLPQPQDSVA